MGNFIRSIKFKIVLAFGLCLSLLVATGVFSILGLSSLNRDINTMYSMNILPISVLGDIRYEQAMVRLVTRRLMSLDDAAQINESVNSTRILLESIREDWNAYYPSQVSGAEELALAGQLADQLTQFDTAVTDFLNALSSNNTRQVEQTRARMVSVGDAMDQFLTKDVELNQTMAAQFSTKAQATSSFLINTAIALVCAGMLASVFIAIYLMRAILRPLEQAIHVASQIAEGKLDNTILVKSMDEFGQLLTALQRMDQHLSGIVREIKSSTESVSTASQEIASGNLDLSARTEQQAASLEETAASMTQLTETVKQNADNARAASTLAGDATGMANVGNDAVQAMVETVDKLSASSNKIAEITNLIEGIAFQTNILALNAAVEAARAGEQGRGFAVVATEVRHLAQRSSSAAKEIKVLIDASVSMTRDGSKQAEGVGETMGKVRNAIQQVAHIVSEIATASSEQSQGIDQVHRAVSQMDDVTQQNAALVEEAAAAAQSLEEQARHLKQAVSVFRVQERAAPLSQPRLLRPLLSS